MPLPATAFAAAPWQQGACKTIKQSSCACFGRQQRTSGLPASGVTAASAFRFFLDGSFFLPLSILVFFFLTLRADDSAVAGSADDMALVSQAAHAVENNTMARCCGYPTGMDAHPLLNGSFTTGECFLRCTRCKCVYHHFLEPSSTRSSSQTDDTLRCCIIQPSLAQSVRACLQYIQMAGLAASFSAAAPARVPTSADFSARSHASHCGLEQVRPERRTWGLRRQQLLARSVPNAASQTAGSTLLEQAASEFCGDGAAGPSVEKCCQQNDFNADSW